MSLSDGRDARLPARDEACYFNQDRARRPRDTDDGISLDCQDDSELIEPAEPRSRRAEVFSESRVEMFRTAPGPAVDYPAANPDEAAGARRLRNSKGDARVGRDVPALGIALELGENNVLTIRIDPNLGQSRHRTQHLRADVRGDGLPRQAKHVK